MNPFTYPTLFLSAPNGEINKLLPYEIKKQIKELAEVKHLRFRYNNKQDPLTLAELWKISKCSYAYFYEGFHEDRKCVIEYFMALGLLGKDKVIAHIPDGVELSLDLVRDKDLFSPEHSEFTLKTVSDFYQPKVRS